MTVVLRFIIATSYRVRLIVSGAKTSVSTITLRPALWLQTTLINRDRGEQVEEHAHGVSGRADFELPGTGNASRSGCRGRAGPPGGRGAA
jgi:hypothetical protein